MVPALADLLDRDHHDDRGNDNQVAGYATPYPTYMRATGSGWAFGVGRIGSIIGPVIGGVLLGLDLSLPRLFLFVAAPALCVAMALLLMRRVAGNYPQREGTV